MVYLFKEGRNLIGFDVVLANRPGTLKFVSSLTEKHDLNIVYFEDCGISRETGRFFMAVDFTDKEFSPEDLIKELRENKDYVLNADISPSLSDIIFPSKFCVKDLGGMRALLIGQGNMKGIILGIKGNLGEEGGNAFLYHLGYGVGEEVYKVYAEPREIKDYAKGILLLEALTRGAGWADIIGYEGADDKIIIKLERLWECEIQKGIVDKPASNYMRGILAGFFKALLGKEVVVKETKCIAVGDPYCQFEINII